MTDEERITELITNAGTIIISVNGGDLEKQSPEWQKHAAKWIVDYIVWLKAFRPDIYRAAVYDKYAVHDQGE